MKQQFKIRHSAALVSAIDMITETGVLKKGQGRTLSAIATHWNDKSLIFPAQTTIAAMTSVHRRTVITHIKALKAIGVIKVTKRPNIMINGEQVRQSDLYRFSEPVLTVLFNKAKKILKAEAKKVAQKEIKANTKNDHLAQGKKDHTISIPNGIQGRDINTVRKSASQVFLEKRIQALTSELAHTAKLKVKAAYDSAVKKNRIARGEIFSDEEIKRRKAIAERTAGARAKAQQVNDKIRSFETALLAWNRTKDGFTKAMFDELSRYQQMLSPTANIIFKRYALTA